MDKTYERLEMRKYCENLFVLNEALIWNSKLFDESVEKLAKGRNKKCLQIMFPFWEDHLELRLNHQKSCHGHVTTSISHP